MRITRVRVYEGPNIFSHFPVVAMLVDLGKYDGRKTTDLPGFQELLLAGMPGLKAHHCASSRPGGFMRRLEDGTFLGHVIEHVALELQAMAGWHVVYGKTRQSEKPGIYNVVFETGPSGAGTEAGRRAVEVVRACACGRSPDVSAHVEAVRLAAEETGLGPSTAAIAAEAATRGIPVRRVGQGSLLILGHGFRQRRVWATVTSRTPCTAVDIAGDKVLTKELLARAGLPVPPGVTVGSRREAARALAELGSPVVVKPASGNQGRGVSLSLSGPSQVKEAYCLARKANGKVLVEKQVAGRHYRLLVVEGAVVAAAERLPARVVGDGMKSIRELTEEANRDPLRGEGHRRPLTRLSIDDVCLATLARQGLTPDSVPAEGRQVNLRENSNLSTGGTARDVTSQVHAENAALAVRAARLVGLDIAGVDIVTPDISRPLSLDGGVVLEVNAAPGLRMHLHPSEGQPRPVAVPIVDALFRGCARELGRGWFSRGSWSRTPGRIPTVAVTGTNGKTTVSRLVAHILTTAGLNVGLASTDGTWVGGDKVSDGDCAGPQSAASILTDPSVHAAVLETARGGIIREGLAFDQCDVGLVTNISADHEGQDGMTTLEDLVYVKALVVETVSRYGHAVLNADDPFVHRMADRARGEVVYFSRSPGNLVVRKHLVGGGRAVYVTPEGLVLEDGGGAGLTHTPSASGPGLHATVIPWDCLPMTVGGLLPFQCENAAAAVAATWSLGVPLEAIHRAFRTFGLAGARGYAASPGRFQVWRVGSRTVVLDYGHNRAAFAEVLGVAGRLCSGRLIAVVGAPGDRLDDHLLEMGRVAARIADHIYIKEDTDTRGRARGEVASLFLRGVLDTGFPEAAVDIVLDERVAVERALERARAGDWVLAFYEKLGPLTELLHAARGRLVSPARLVRDAAPAGASARRRQRSRRGPRKSAAAPGLS